LSHLPSQAFIWGERTVGRKDTCCIGSSSSRALSSFFL
jgi:hypothetical protein